MRKFAIPLLALLAGCGQGGGEPGNAGANQVQAIPARAPVQTATLTGLYETGGTPPSQLCITEQGRTASFGLVIRRNGRPGCSGAGTATRRGTTLRLAMNGESACTIEARLDGTQVTFPASLPASCSYYCPPGGAAGAGGTIFQKNGGTRDNARRARDLAGGPLCT